ncbi:DUF6088 family protein [Pseudomonas sp. GD03860]|uniref:DUF6088 family protein n=1 Tax=Pseudomonas TaxID=286 RepID=UPI0023635D7E|nr:MULTISPECIES: DUF6088 family protein [Pseudomonas]MDD2058440.1 DUF6088 family protein [Pseudomonas putida]MDH0640878.1 DUF6088 family protein [Pseudomonas sp. GD03860]
MNLTLSIIKKLLGMRKGSAFTRLVFKDLGTPASINGVLARLARAGVLERVVRGVYMRPKWNVYIGNVRPCPTQVMKVIASARGEVIQCHGAEAVRMFRLSTQIQVQPIYYTSGRSRVIQVDRALIRLKHVSSNRLQYAGTRVGLALTALHFLGKTEVSDAVIAQIYGMLNEGEKRLLLACKMPRWMKSALMRTEVGNLDRLLTQERATSN